MSDTNVESQLRLANTELKRRIALLEEILAGKGEGRGGAARFREALPTAL